MKDAEVLKSDSDNRDISISKETIVNSINADEVFIKYHVHTVINTDTIESILAKYNVSLCDLKKYNTFDTLELDMKLIIPENEEN